MELLPAELRAKIPPRYSQEKVKDPVVHVLCSEELDVLCSGGSYVAFRRQHQQDRPFYSGRSFCNRT